MKVSKWGGSLAVRLPKDMVTSEGIIEGEDIDIVIVKKSPSQRPNDKAHLEALNELDSFRWPVEPGYKFSREEANER
jgi:antitoxin MazE